jgi:hypothetical protein
MRLAVDDVAPGTRAVVSSSVSLLRHHASSRPHTGRRLSLRRFAVFTSQDLIGMQAVDHFPFFFFDGVAFARAVFDTTAVYYRNYAFVILNQACFAQRFSCGRDLLGLQSEHIFNQFDVMLI